jgi:hypothetical protein
MKAIDRVMRAYSRTHQLTEAQTAMVRQDLSAFIDELLAGKKPDDRILPVGSKPANP